MKIVKFAFILILILCLPGFMSCLNYRLGECTVLVEIIIFGTWLLNKITKSN
jgi:hypothetical protein